MLLFYVKLPPYTIPFQSTDALTKYLNTYRLSAIQLPFSKRDRRPPCIKYIQRVLDVRDQFRLIEFPRKGNIRRTKCLFLSKEYKITIMMEKVILKSV